MRPSSDPDVRLADITISLSLEEVGDEITGLEFPDELGGAQILGIVELCKISVLRSGEGET